MQKAMYRTFLRAIYAAPGKRGSRPGRTRPLAALFVTAGQAGDAPAFEAIMGRIRVPRTGPGRPRTRPATVLADRAYSSLTIRGHLRRRGIRAVTPQPADQTGHRPPHGRRGLAMRTDKLAIAFQAALHLTAILIWTHG
ncbi:hypothetical protein SUDANB58_00598 [Streptomyces sp. enrichment culture]